MHLKKCLHYSELLQQSTRKASFSFDNAMKVDCTYRRSKFGRLGGLPALLTNWGKRRAHGRYVVRGEATVQLAAHIVGGAADLVASSVAERERIFARGAEAPVACRIGHFELELEIHWMPGISATIRCMST
jgi:hypothetical protein